MHRARSCPALLPVGGYDLPGAKATKAMKDEGLVFCILKCLSLREARQLWNVQRAFFRVLDGKVVPLLALYERDWGLVSHYMNFPASGFLEGHPRFEYNYDSICVEAIRHQDFEGLQLLAQRRYDFRAVHRDQRLFRFAREALVQGRYEQLFTLRAVLFDFSEILAECAAKEELSENLFVAQSITVDFLGQRLHYCCSALDFASTDYVERSLASHCTNRDSLFKVPFIMAAFIRAGASPCCLLREDGCGYLLLLAIASESFNFVYLLVKEAIHLGAVFRLYSDQFLRMALRALEQQHPLVLDLLHFCGYRLAGEEALSQFDPAVLRYILAEDFSPIERLCRLGFSMRQFAERNQADFQAFLQERLEASPSPCCRSQRSGVHPAIQRLACLDRRALEPHFRSQTFLKFVEDLLAKRSFVVLRQIVEVHPYAFDAYFAENFATLEAMLMDAFMLRDTSLIVDLTSLTFPMGHFFLRKQAEVDSVLLNAWLPNKCWTDLGMLKSEVRHWSFPGFFERNRGRSDDFVVGIIENGYWFDLHNLAQLSFDFPSFFDRRFGEVSAAALGFIAVAHPHFVLLRELSALGFPWERFRGAHRETLPPPEEDDFLSFVMSSDGFELGSKVYGVVEQTRRLYHSMAASMFGVYSVPAGMAAAGRTAAPAEAAASTRNRAGAGAAVASTDRGRAAGSSAAAAGCPAAAPSRQRGQGSRQPDDAAAKQPPASVQAGEQQAAHALRARAKELARRAREKKLDHKKVLTLTVCKGAYCWSPLDADLEDPGDGQDPSVWANIESVLNFLECKDDEAAAQASSTYSHLLPHHLGQALAAGVPGSAAVTAGVAGAVFGGVAVQQPALPAPGTAGPPPPGHLPMPVPAAAVGPPLQFPGVGQASQHQLLFHIVCLAQRAEERAFAQNVELFWDGVLDSALPLSAPL